MGDANDPSFVEISSLHQKYVDALADAGLSVTVEAPLDDYPDSVFVEDPALCLADCAVMLRPGAPSRVGESKYAKAALQHFYEPDAIFELPVGAQADGGDILITQDDVFVGGSRRTNQDGVRALRAILEPMGYTVRLCDVPANLLHLKTGCSLVDDGVIFGLKELAPSFRSYEFIECAEDEPAAANAIRINDDIFCADGFPKSLMALEKIGVRLRRFDVTELTKIDAGLSCMSLRF